MPLRLNERVKWDVLKVLSAVDQCQRISTSARVGLRVDIRERIGCVLGDVVVDSAANLVENRLDRSGDSGGKADSGVKLGEERVEEGRRCAHNETGIVEAGDAVAPSLELAGAEFGADVLCWGKGVE